MGHSSHFCQFISSFWICWWCKSFDFINYKNCLGLFKTRAALKWQQSTLVLAPPKPCLLINLFRILFLQSEMVQKVLLVFLVITLLAKYKCQNTLQFSLKSILTFFFLFISLHLSPSLCVSARLCDCKRGDRLVETHCCGLDIHIPPVFWQHISQEGSKVLLEFLFLPFDIKEWSLWWQNTHDSRGRN